MSVKSDFEDLAKVLLRHMTVDGLKKTLKERHPDLSLQGTKEVLQIRLANAEGLKLATTPTAAKSAAKKIDLPPGYTGNADIDAGVDDMIKQFNAARTGKTKTANNGAARKSAKGKGSRKKSFKCTLCNKSYSSKAHDVTDFTEGLCKECAVDQGCILDCTFCGKKNLPEYYGAWCDCCPNAGCKRHFPDEDVWICINCSK